MAAGGLSADGLDLGVKLQPGLDDPVAQDDGHVHIDERVDEGGGEVGVVSG